MRPLATPIPCLAILLSACLAGCATRSTAPLPGPQFHRFTTVIVTDSLGTPALGAEVSFATPVDTGGMVVISIQVTDADGRASLELPEGPCTASVQPVTVAPAPARRLVAAGKFVVPGSGSPAADTVLVRLRLGTASRVTGRVLLAGRGEHSGTFVIAPDCFFAFAGTDSSGRYALEDLPPGTWTLAFDHPTFAPATQTVTVPAPGSTLSLADVTLPAH